MTMIFEKDIYKISAKTKPHMKIALSYTCAVHDFVVVAL